MFKKIFIQAVITAFSFMLFAQNANAVTVNETTTKSTLNADALKATINASLGIKVDQVVETAMPGIALLVTDKGLFYSSFDGAFLIEGKVYSVANNLAELSELSLAKIRLAGLSEFEDNMVVYKAKDEKYVVTVFTDITCGYCRKMHGQMDGYNARGITFRYLAYPRAGIKDEKGNFTQGYKDIRSAWCSDDPAQALTKAKAGESIPYRTCDASIAKQLTFGRQMGVKGTPAIVLPNGLMAPGYVPPAKLESILKDL